MNRSLLDTGTYTSAKPDLQFHVQVPLAIGNNAIVVTGENGSGKTTFLEQICIPRIREFTLRQFYVGADRHIARAVFAAALGLRRFQGRKERLLDADLAPLHPLSKLVCACLREFDAEVVAFDEYPEDVASVVETWGRVPRLIIAISHSPDEIQGRLSSIGLPVTAIRLERIGEAVLVQPCK
jgi:hypothetical protein